MKLTNISGFGTIDAFVAHKLEAFAKDEKTFATLFFYMFSEKENTMYETSDGFRIQKTTYGDCRERILLRASAMAEALSGIPSGALIGLAMDNSPLWLESFWSILLLGYRPLLMNLRLPASLLESVLDEHKVAAVISDGRTYGVPTFDAGTLAGEGRVPYEPTTWGDEVVFMSSGTTGAVKLCAYTAENFYYQIADSAAIIRNCPEIKRHYEGEIKQLMLLPLYHVFGFIAVYLWFGFFSRSFVFLKDLNPSTLLNTVRKHKVTHIFAVPLVWDTVCREAMKKIRARGEKTYNKFQKAIRSFNKLGAFGNILAKKALREVRDNLFGDSICFLISGGSQVSEGTLAFFNGIGYHMATGYGMTEVGITSVEVSNSKKRLNSASVGHAFGNTEYALSEKGELLVRGKTMAARVTVKSVVTVTDYSVWFNTKDLARCEGDAYYIDGRCDDLIILQNGENLNPVLIEPKLKVAGCRSLCLFADENKQPVLLVSITACFSAERLKAIGDALNEALRAAHLEGSVKKIRFTLDALLEKNDFKISRRGVAKRYAAGDFRLLDLADPSKEVSRLKTELEKEVSALVAEALEKPIEEVGVNDGFFLDLGGTSLDYFALIGLVRSRYGVELPMNDGERLVSVKSLCDYIAGS